VGGSDNGQCTLGNSVSACFTSAVSYSAPVWLVARKEEQTSIFDRIRSTNDLGALYQCRVPVLFLSSPGNLVPALVLSVLGFGHFGVSKFGGNGFSEPDEAH
jgi:hypothetical protein